MSSVASICFYQIIPHRVRSKFDLEQSPVHSCFCYTDPKIKNTKQIMAHKDCMQLHTSNYISS